MQIQNIHPFVSSGLGVSAQSRTLTVLSKMQLKEVKVFLGALGVSIRQSRQSGSYTMTVPGTRRSVLPNLDIATVLDYAIARGFTGFDDFDPDPSNVIPFVPKQFPDFSAQGVDLYNRDYKTVASPAGALTVTDPPYGIGFGYDRHNDKMTDEQWLVMMDQVQKPCVVIVPFEKMCVMVADPRWGKPDDYVTWVYNGGYRGHQHRLILWYGCKPDMTREAVGQDFKDPNSIWAKKAKAKGRTKARRYYWWHIEQVMSGSKEKTPHPCQIPEEVIRLIVQSTADEGQPIFEPFLGSGTTGVIARRFGHPFTGTDLSPDYCEIAKNRIMAVVPKAQPAVSNVIPFVLPVREEEVNLHNADYRTVQSFPADSLIVSDPPYGVGYRYDVHNDKQTDAQWLEMMSGLKGEKCVLILPKKRTHQLIKAWGVPEYSVTWVYHSNLPEQCREITWWNCKPDLSLPAVGQPYQNPEDKRVQGLMAQGKLARRYTWWEVEQVKNKSKQKTAHPCQIPEEVIRLIIQSTAREGQHICDPFLGSGTTGVVAHRYGHPFSGWDISAAYVEIARDRIAKESGDDAGSSKKAA